MLGVKVGAMSPEKYQGRKRFGAIVWRGPGNTLEVR
jgi:hypothetical protein